jgi:hypothetical protein
VTSTLPLATPAPGSVARGLGARFRCFVLEREPHALALAAAAWDTLGSPEPGRDAAAIDALRAPLRDSLLHLLDGAAARVDALGETTPRVPATRRQEQARDSLLAAGDGFLRREALAASLTRDERREILRGMLLTRATDNRLKAFFTGGEVRYEGVAFQGKGFRSLGQEAIYAAPLRLRRGAAYRSEDGRWGGDVVAPSSGTWGPPCACGRTRRACAASSPRRWPRRGRPWTAATCTWATSTGGSSPPPPPSASPP